MDEMMVLVGQIGSLVFAPKWLYRTPETFIRSVVIPFMDGADDEFDDALDQSPTVMNLDPDEDDSDFSLALSPDTMINEARTIMLLRALETRHLRPNEETGGLEWGDDVSGGTPVWVVDFDRLEQVWKDSDDADDTGSGDDGEDEDE